jgi:hypothetical protein
MLMKCKWEKHVKWSLQFGNNGQTIEVSCKDIGIRLIYTSALTNKSYVLLHHTKTNSATPPIVYTLQRLP